MFRQHGVSLRTFSLIARNSRCFATSACSRSPRKKKESPSDVDDGDAKDGPSDLKRRAQDASETQEPEVPLVGLLAKQVRLEQSLKRRTAYYKGKAARDAANAAGLEPASKPERKSAMDGTSAELLRQGSKHHTDLKSFLEYAEQNKLKTSTTVYKGTLFEYTVAETLKPFGFELSRTGRSNDLGIDLLGLWRLPEEPHEMRVLIQCKVTKPTPATTRELEGAYVGAPSAWQGNNVLALLVSTKPSTKGVVTAVQRSKSPIGVAQIDLDGNVRQLLWNAVAEERGLAGLGVTVRYKAGPQISTTSSKQSQDNDMATDLVETIALTWKGEPLELSSE